MFVLQYPLSQCDWPTSPGTSTSNCLNGGTCRFVTAGGPQNCNCSSAVAGYNTAPQTTLTSARCNSYQTNKCSPNPCANGATCTNFGTTYVCT